MGYDQYNRNGVTQYRVGIDRFNNNIEEKTCLIKCPQNFKKYYENTVVTFNFRNIYRQQFQTDSLSEIKAYRITRSAVFNIRSITYLKKNEKTN